MDLLLTVVKIVQVTQPSMIHGFVVLIMPRACLHVVGIAMVMMMAGALVVNYVTVVFKNLLTFLMKKRVIKFDGSLILLTISTKFFCPVSCLCITL
jgi:hypothetical protein